MAINQAATARAEWRANWPVVLAGVAGGSLATLHLYSIGLMIEPLEREFGWTRAEASSGLTIIAVFGVILSPFIGMIIDRLGPRRVALFGVPVFCLFLALLSQASASIGAWWALWCGLAIGAACIAPTVWAAGTTSLFARSRGMALAVTLCGTSIGALIVPAVTHGFVEALGWRGAYLALAGAWIVLTLPLVWFGFAGAIDRRIKETPATSEAGTGTHRAYVLKAIRSCRFVKLALAAISIVTVASSLLSNIVPILIAEGHSAGTAASLAGLIGAVSIAGRLCGGLLLDRIDGRLVAGASVLMPVFSCLILLWTPESAALVGIGIFILGLAVGIEWDAVAYLASRHFGVASFGTIFGTIGGLSLLLNGLGPVATNHVYDATGSYQAALQAFIPLCLLSSALFLLLGPYPASTPEAGPEA